MNKSKYKYKIYNGKALKELIENSKVYIFSILFAIGIIMGALSMNSNSELLKSIKELTESFLDTRSQQGIIENFYDSFVINSLLLLLNIFFAFSLIGYPFIVWLPIIRGMGTGVIIGYIYSTYKITGLAYSVLTLCPGIAVSTVAFILSCNNSCDYSKNAFMKALRGRGQFEKDETKVYLFRQSILLAVCAASSVIDSVFSFLFLRFFEV